MKKISPGLKYIFQNTIFLGLLYYGIVEQVAGAYNVALFMAWIAIFTSFMVFSNDDVKDVYLSIGRSAPAWIDIPLDLFVCGVFVWDGAWITGLFWFISMCLMVEVLKKSHGETA